MTITATQAKAEFHALIEKTQTAYAPITITDKRGNAVLMSEEAWNAIQETLYLVSIPGMRESIIEGLATDLSETEKTLDW